jgi:hypothetical protein
MESFRMLALAAATERAAAQPALKASNTPVAQAKRPSGILKFPRFITAPAPLRQA